MPHQPRNPADEFRHLLHAASGNQHHAIAEQLHPRGYLHLIETGQYGLSKPIYNEREAKSSE